MLALSQYEKQNVYLQEVIYDHSRHFVEYILRTETERVNKDCNYLSKVPFCLTKSALRRLFLEEQVFTWYQFRIKSTGFTFVNTSNGDAYTAQELWLWQKGNAANLKSMIKDEFLSILKVQKQGWLNDELI